MSISDMLHGHFYGFKRRPSTGLRLATSQAGISWPRNTGEHTASSKSIPRHVSQSALQQCRPVHDDVNLVEGPLLLHLNDESAV